MGSWLRLLPKSVLSTCAKKNIGLVNMKHLFKVKLEFLQPKPDFCFYPNFHHNNHTSDDKTE